MMNKTNQHLWKILGCSKMIKRTNEKLWEILVPVFDDKHSDKHNMEWPVEYHQKWDQHVRQIAGGLTINKIVRGIWTCPNTKIIFHEQMIPVRIFCTLKEIEEIIDFTLKYYDQEAIMCYLISDTVFIKYKE